MTWRGRVLTFGSCGLLVVAGALIAALVGGETWQVVGFGLVGAAAIVATGLVFLEVGYSEDRERAREGEAARQQRPNRPLHPDGIRLERPGRHRRRPG